MLDASQTQQPEQILLGNTAPIPQAYNLTPRLRQVGELLAEGLSNKLIGVKLNISGHTVKFHVNELMRKLGVTTRSAVVAKLLRSGTMV